MKHIWRRITQLRARATAAANRLWVNARTAARALRRNRWTLSKAAATGAAYQTGVALVMFLYFWWTSRH